MRAAEVKTCGRWTGIWRSFRCLLFLAALALVPLSPCLFGDCVLLPADLLMVMQPFSAHSHEMGFSRVSNPILDAVQQFWPWRKYAGEQLRQGTIPLWNPYMLSGTPFVANNQSAVFYPETWLFALMTPERAFGWAAALYLFASGSFMFCLLRTLSLRRRAALLGAVAWMYNGFVVGWMCLPSFRSVPGWLPLILCAYEKARRSSPGGQWPWVALGALAVGLQFLAGNLHISFYVILIFGLYVLATACFGRRNHSTLRSLGAAALIAAGGVALASIQLLPTLELVARSQRRGVTYADSLTYRLPWLYVFAGLMPDLFGNPVDYNHWGCFLGQQYRAYTETAWYTGAFTVVLAVFALVRHPSRSVYFWGGLIVLAFALALGSPLNLLFRVAVPGFRQLPGINRAIVMACFALPMLAAWGVQRLLESSREPGSLSTDLRALRHVLAALVVVAFGGAVWAWMVSAPYEGGGIPVGSQPWIQWARFAALAVVSAELVVLALRQGRPLWAGAVLLLLAVDVGYFGAHFIPLVSAKYVRPPSEIVSRLEAMQDRARTLGRPFRLLSVGQNSLRDRMPPNVPMIFGLQDVQGSDSLSYGRYAQLLAAVSDERLGFSQPAWDHPLARTLGVAALVGAIDLPSSTQFRLTLTEGEGRLYVLPPFAWWRAQRASYVRGAIDDAEMLRLTTDAQQDPARWSPVAFVEDLKRLDSMAHGSDSGHPMGAKLGQGPCPRGGWWTVGSFGAQLRPVFLQELGPNALRLLPATPTRPAPSGNEYVSTFSLARFMPGDFLVLHDTYFPGWRAYVNGEQAPILCVDYCFRGVVVPDGPPADRVDFVYEPTSCKLGGFLSVLALAGAVTLLTLRRLSADRRLPSEGEAT